MVIDKISNAGNYTGMIQNLDAALRFIDGNYDLPLGRHEFEGGAVIASEGLSAPLAQREFEAHKNFADVMFILEHDETVSYRQTEELTCTKPYDADTDCAMYGGQGMDILVTVPKGYFYTMLPGEGHKPCVHVESEKPFKKYIIKCGVAPRPCNL